MKTLNPCRFCKLLPHMELGKEIIQMKRLDGSIAMEQLAVISCSGDCGNNTITVGTVSGCTQQWNEENSTLTVDITKTQEYISDSLDECNLCHDTFPISQLNLTNTQYLCSKCQKE